MDILQSTNHSVYINLNKDLTSMPVVDVGLYANDIRGKCLKHWVLYKEETDSGVIKDIHLIGTTLQLDFTQAETSIFPEGYAVYDIKYMDTSGVTQFYKLLRTKIVKRYNIDTIGDL